MAALDNINQFTYDMILGQDVGVEGSLQIVVIMQPT